MERTLLIMTQGLTDLPQNLTDMEFTTRVLTPDMNAEERADLLSKAEIIFGEPTREELFAAKDLRWLQLTWAGADRYTDSDFPASVMLTTASGAFGETVAEHALSMLLALCRRLPAYVRGGAWRDLGCEKRVSGSTALIFGCGDIGCNIAKRLRALGVHTVGVCRDVRRKREGFDVLTTLSCAEAFFSEADFILSAMPQQPETVGYFNGKRLEALKRGAVFINVGRGSITDTDALTEALRTNQLFGVGLDVVSPEPLPEDHPLWNLPNAIITPHVAGVSFGHLPQVEQQIQGICIDNLRRYVQGLPLRNQVTPL